MPRSLVKDDEARRSEILFGSGCRKVNIAELARQTKLPQSTLCRYRTRTDDIRLGTLVEIVKVLHLSEEDLLQLFR